MGIGGHGLKGSILMRFLLKIYTGYLRGQSNEIFRPPFFFTKRLVLVSIDMPKSDFEFCQIFVELFVLKISKYCLPAVTDSGESKFSLRQPIFLTLLKCSW